MKFHDIGRIHKLFTTLHDTLESKVLVNDCRFGVSPVVHPDPDPDPERKFSFCTINVFFFLFLIYNRIIENVFVYLFIYLLTSL